LLEDGVVRHGMTDAKPLLNPELFKPNQKICKKTLSTAGRNALYSATDMLF
jgi:hypothetical protein